MLSISLLLQFVVVNVSLVVLMTFRSIHTVGYAICYTVVCMIYVVLLVIFSSLCRGGYTAIFSRVVTYLYY